jgi:hypothetical protein
VGWDEPVPNHPGDPTARGRYAVAVRPAGGSFGAPQVLGPEVQGSRTATLRLLPGNAVLAMVDTWTAQADDTFLLRG